MRIAYSPRVLISALAVSALALSACAPVGLSNPQTMASTAPVPSVATSGPAVAPPSVTAVSPSPATAHVASSAPAATPEQGAPADLTLLKPGTNHNWAADEAGYVYPAATVNAWITGKKKRPNKKIVFLTFDDGPNKNTSHVILDALKAEGVHATFFVVGSMVDESHEALKREIAEGHSVGLHSWSHDYRILYPGRVGSTSNIMGEYTRTLAKVRSVLGKDYHSESWRYPGGHMSWSGLSGADKGLAANGVTWIDWNADTEDSAPISQRPKTIAQTVHNATLNVSAGYHVIVVLGHDTFEKRLTSQSVPAMIKAFKKAGYEFGTIS